ncbi:TRAP-type C4-dicarboxylate transport system permease small subunit [Mesorhizobium sp. J18]|uniref:TRAP transporter small permease n=1 Tax=Mesorhizobium sp. J18 TaxID=935263 RepID=UPI00119BFC90|nr:TRAP transporter small permease [Mesorhizobium sp. J18]TWG96396.1 TRAP-type C4-dicarboxylate transport system permease small subunit [Mesorhizobium sp. J18]
MSDRTTKDGEGARRALQWAQALYAAVSDVLARTLLWTVIGAIVVMLGCISLQVFMRYFLGAPPSWAEEVAMLAFSWSALGALPLGVREGFHVRIELLKVASPALKGAGERLLNFLIAAFGVFLAWAGWRFVDFTAGGRSAAARYPLELLHAMAPIAGALLVVFALQRAFSTSVPTLPDPEMAQP